LGVETIFFGPVHHELGPYFARRWNIKHFTGELSVFAVNSRGDYVVEKGTERLNSYIQRACYQNCFVTSGTMCAHPSYTRWE
tara:strand:- start:426 stop:671 length:246 start_codon:yes stop_codon:yes gene_type:complete